MLIIYEYVCIWLEFYDVSISAISNIQELQNIIFFRMFFFTSSKVALHNKSFGGA